ncbi:MAG: purine-binding chemotaxis protein CheW [Bdellovibrionales bacterium]|nr:purine-binding chemotaxis protein CheW [Bdellovibrionales bacterium]
MEMSNVEQSQDMEKASSERFLSFSLGQEEYAMPLLKVREVIAMPEVTPIPQTPSFFLGIMNLRGQVISILDLRTKLGIKPANGSETAVIICELSPVCLGVVVDSVNAVLSPKAGEISGKPDAQMNKNTDYITGVYRREKSLVLFLDIAKTLDVKQMEMVQNAAKAAA